MNIFPVKVITSLLFLFGVVTATFSSDDFYFRVHCSFCQNCQNSEAKLTDREQIQRACCEVWHMVYNFVSHFVYCVDE